LGSTIALTNPNGAVKSQFKYEPFGRTTVSGDTTTNRYRFTGREDEEMDLYYLRGRYYSQELHRFISRDPVGFAGGDPNLYSYAGNSPTNFTDPLGLFCCVAGIPGTIFGNGQSDGWAQVNEAKGAGGQSGIGGIGGGGWGWNIGGEFGVQGGAGIVADVGGAITSGPISGLQLVQAQRTPTPFHFSPFPGLTHRAYSTWRGAGYSDAEIEAAINNPEIGLDYMNEAAHVEDLPTPGATPSPSGPTPTPGPAGPGTFRG
jgi:RHS repeat-associated protein